MGRTVFAARAALLLCLIFALLAAPASAQEVAGDRHWIGTWGTAVTQLGHPGGPRRPLSFEDQTLRQIVHRQPARSRAARAPLQRVRQQLRS